MSEENAGVCVISSDSVRKELYGDASVQKDHAKVFAICHARMGRAIREGKDVIFDATNLVPKHRIDLISMANANGSVFIIGVVYTGSLDVCIGQNEMRRERQVPEGVIRNMYDTLHRFPPSWGEGFDALISMESLKLSSRIFPLLK